MAFAKVRQFLPYYLRMAREFRNGIQMACSFHFDRPLGKAVLRDGTLLLHPPHRSGLVDTILEVWMMNAYTREEWRTPFYSPSDGDVVLDLGANVGLFSVLLARRNPRCRIHAVEPFGENFEFLSQNVERNHLNNIAVHRLAIGRDDGKGSMVVGSSQRSLDYTLDPNASSEGDHAVNIFSLGGLLDHLGLARVALLKVDIEGAEHDAFASVDESTLARFDRIAIEYHDNIRPGTLDLLQSRLSHTHEMTVCPSDPSFGILFGVRKNLGIDN